MQDFPTLPFWRPSPTTGGERAPVTKLKKAPRNLVVQRANLPVTSPCSASQSQIFFFHRRPLPRLPATTPRSFAKLPGPYASVRPSPDRHLRQRRGGIARAEERRRRSRATGTAEAGQGEARVWGRGRVASAGAPVREEDAYDAAAEEHRLRPLVRLRSGESLTSRPSPHRDSWPGNPHWVFSDAMRMFGFVPLAFIRSSLAASAWFVPFFCLSRLPHL